jgi:archaellum component FlaC
MVDSRNGGAVTSDGNAWPGRLETVEQKIDILAASMDARFDEVTAALVEQRQDTEFASTQLNARMDGFDVRLGRVEDRIDPVEDRLDGVDSRLEGIDTRLGGIERKLDQFIDVQSRANELVERRLQALERPRRKR